MKYLLHSIQSTHIFNHLSMSCYSCKLIWSKSTLWSCCPECFSLAPWSGKSSPCQGRCTTFLPSSSESRWWERVQSCTVPHWLSLRPIRPTPECLHCWSHLWVKRNGQFYLTTHSTHFNNMVKPEFYHLFGTHSILTGHSPGIWSVKFTINHLWFN